MALKPPATEKIRSLQWKCDEIEVFSLNYDNGLYSDTGSYIANDQFQWCSKTLQLNSILCDKL